MRRAAEQTERPFSHFMTAIRAEDLPSLFLQRRAKNGSFVEGGEFSGIAADPPPSSFLSSHRRRKKLSKSESLSVSEEGEGKEKSSHVIRWRKRRRRRHFKKKREGSRPMWRSGEVGQDPIQSPPSPSSPPPLPILLRIFRPKFHPPLGLPFPPSRPEK